MEKNSSGFKKNKAAILFIVSLVKITDPIRCIKGAPKPDHSALKATVCFGSAMFGVTFNLVSRVGVP